MNAKKEILGHINNREVEFIRVEILDRRGLSSVMTKPIEGKLDEVLPLVDFDYDDGYGSQKLGGVIWYADGTWSDRREYDGSEWWEHHVRPSLPDNTLKGGEKNE